MMTKITLISMRAGRSRALSRKTITAALAASFSCLLPGAAYAVPESSALQVQLPAGIVEGTSLTANGTELRAFKGIPFAAPPVGALRWREPQPVAQWAGVRQTKQFGPRCMQQDLFQMTYRSDGMSEDCLYLNVWTPARNQSQSEGEKRPVLVYFYGGGFAAGDGSEPRYDGANLAARGIVTVTVNYRLGVFGFLALHKLEHESPHRATGNYGLLDQTAALKWVRENIARFGGDPEQVTIAGESAGSMSVNAHMASPLSRGLFARAIGESGAAFSPGQMWSLDRAKSFGSQFTERFGTNSLVRLRALSAQTLLDATGPNATPKTFFWPVVDGHFLRQRPEVVFTSGQQARVPLLLGGNSQEGHYVAVLKGAEPTPENWRAALKRLFASKADQALAFYPGHDNEEVIRSATALASDLFINNQVWRWMESHRAADVPTYFYMYTQPLPPKVGAQPGEPPATGAVHAAEIEYALDNLDGEAVYAWTAKDREVSRIFSGYLTQFIKSGNPNGAQLPDWPVAGDDQGGVLRQMIGANTYTEVAREAQRQALVQSLFPTRGSSTGDD
jgi:para-nitrobenzyl esterase